MRFPKKKTYGVYKTSTCPFCDRTATSKNQQGLDVCHQHTKNVLNESKCLCGCWLELRTGKFGPYFSCEKCGNINFKKGIEIRESIKPLDVKEELSRLTEKEEVDKEKTVEKKSRKEITISTDDVEYFS